MLHRKVVKIVIISWTRDQSFSSFGKPHMLVLQEKWNGLDSIFSCSHFLLQRVLSYWPGGFHLQFKLDFTRVWGEVWSCYAVQADLKFQTPLLPTSECWDHKHAPPQAGVEPFLEPFGGEAHGLR